MASGSRTWRQKMKLTWKGHRGCAKNCTAIGIDWLTSLNQTVVAWIRNNWRLGQSPTNAKILIKHSELIWTYHQQLVFAQIADMLHIPKATQDTPGWFNHRMRAIKMVYDNMSKPEKESLQAKKNELSRQGFPEDEKPMWHFSTYMVSALYADIYWLCRRAAHFANRRLDAAAKAQFLEMGLLSITFMSRMEKTSSGDYRVAVEV